VIKLLIKLISKYISED